MTPFITRLGFRAGALCSHQLWNQAMHCNASDFTWWPNFETFCNKWQNTYPKKYKSDFKKYCKSEGEIQEHLNWDFAARESRPCGQVSCFWFLPEEAGRVYAHPLLQVQVQYMITISSLYPKTTSFITRLGFREGALCSHQHLSSIVPPKTRILGPQIGDLLLTLSDTCMLYIFRKLSSASTSLTKN